MVKKHTLLFSAGATLSLVTFFGCGGVDPKPTTYIEKKQNQRFITQSGFRGQIKIENGNQKMSSVMSNQILQEPLSTCNLVVYQAIQDAINRNQLVKLSLSYKTLNDHIASTRVYANDGRLIGINFIYYPSEQKTEGLMYVASMYTENWKKKDELTGFALYINSLDTLWSKETDKAIINQALKNNSRTSWEASFSLQKTITGDYQFSNIKAPGPLSTQNSFTLRSDQYTTTDLKKLQLMLSTLFVNFEKAKEIFN